MTNALRAVLTDQGLWWAAALGGLGSLVSIPAHRRIGHILWASLPAAAAAGAMLAVGSGSIWLVAGVAASSLAGLLLPDNRPALGVAAAAAGIGMAAGLAPVWVAAGTAVLPAIIALTSEKGPTAPSDVALLAIVAVGTWLTVPDTEAALPLATALVIVGGAAWILRRDLDGPVAVTGVALAVVWVAATGGAARVSAVLAPWALLLPFVFRRHWRVAGSGPTLVGYIIYALIVVRVFGRLGSPAAAATGMAAMALAWFVTGLGLAARHTPGRRRIRQ